VNPIIGIDPGIAPFVAVLRAGGVETIESCEGGPGHAMPEPTVIFSGGVEAGWHALARAMEVGLPVLALRRTWVVVRGEATGPLWEMTFRAGDAPAPGRK